MRLITLIILSGITCCCSFAEIKNDEYPKLPDSPLALIEELKTTTGIYTTWEIKLNYVSEKDIPALMNLLDSEEPCGYSVMSLSSYLPSGHSTVGHEAAYLIESFWKQYYPIRLTSANAGVPDKEQIKAWYRRWKNLKEMQNQELEPTRTTPVESGND